jgi:hypothetical protein
MIEAKEIYKEEEKPRYRRKREHKYKCAFCGFESSREKYVFKRRRNFPHGRKSKSKITLICKSCKKIQ